jgi:hypothetical protein
MPNMNTRGRSIKKFGSRPEGSRPLLPSELETSPSLLSYWVLGGDLIQFRAKERKGQAVKKWRLIFSNSFFELSNAAALRW